MPVLIYFVSFVVLALASRQIGKFLARLRLPLISGYLIAGVLIGPFVLELVPARALEDLRFIDEVALAFIAFAAGSELNIAEIRKVARSIALHTLGQIVAIFFIGSAAVYFLAGSIPFLQGAAQEVRIAVSILIGAILVARSPSSALAIVSELRARGPFTRTFLGVTVVMDVAVVVLYAFTASVAGVLLSAEAFNLGFLALLAVELALSVFAGLLVGKILEVILSARLDEMIKIVSILLTGYAVFFLSHSLHDWSEHNLVVAILLEPLLICMVGSFYVTNFSPRRAQFLDILHDVGPTIYIAFFTLIGVSLRIDILLQTLVITVVILLVRLVGLFVGSLIGGTLAGDPPRQNRIAWMAYVTQAGVGLGLAKEAASEFNALGEEFATLIVSVIVLSQIIGPPMLKWAIKYVGEAHSAEAPDHVRDALILGIDVQSRALARQLQGHHWKVVMADTQGDYIEEGDDLDERLVPAFDDAALKSLVETPPDAVVLLLHDDEKKLEVARRVRDLFPASRLIVHLNDLAAGEALKALGAEVVYPASAMVHLLDRFVRNPQSVSLLLERDPEFQIEEITISNSAVHGLPLRDIRLPSDVLVLGVMHNGESIVPHGYTPIHVNDRLMLLGHPESLDEVTRRLGY